MDTSPLITVEDLRQDHADLTILDVRYRLGGPPGREEFTTGHVPGASYVDLDTALASSPGDPVDERGRHPLPEPADFIAAMQAVGVGLERPVVVYDDWGGRAAARAWWLLRHYGHRSVRVLDGGWPAWLAAGERSRPATSSPSAATSTAARARCGWWAPTPWSASPSSSTREPPSASGGRPSRSTRWQGTCRVP
ncbi:sulfurtransferase [Nocardioides piscis]|uniref:sulfurtransferase n=1 Tax=Nocardioides piscis TaxID=2714938 RepID=UPI001FEC5C5E|nr:rhodanese-like domain-containing protein [Nocardioides piscis]